MNTLTSLLQQYKKGWSLERPFYTDAGLLCSEADLIWKKNWFLRVFHVRSLIQVIILPTPLWINPSSLSEMMMAGFMPTITRADTEARRSVWKSVATKSG